MNVYSMGRVVWVAAIGVCFGISANAITVQEVGVNPNEIVAINCTLGNNLDVYAGINQLVVDGVAMNGFCIDPYHYSLASSSGYSYVPLTSAPKGYIMSGDDATYIERLWGSYYSASMSAQDAAGLQIAIWAVVSGDTIVNGKISGGTFSLVNPASDYGAGAMLSAVDFGNITAYSGPKADLIALTGPGQDYAVATPDGGTTIAMLGMALCGLGVVGAAFRSKRWANLLG